jgi:ribosomal protein S18 acetylase RimI-like enzyme
MDQFPAGSLVVRTASPDELGLVLGLLRAASSARKGNGSPWGTEFPDIPGDVAEGLAHLGWEGRRVLGTFVLRWSDAQVWGPDDGQCGYLHRLAVHPHTAGQGIGRRLVDAAGELAAERGRGWLRLDCDRDNPRLRAYYEAQGFQHVRDVDSVPRQTRQGTRAASLYQRPAPSKA